MYKLNVVDRNYNETSIVDSKNLNVVLNIELNPVKNKLFTQDIFNVNENNIEIIHSPVRSKPLIPAILVLEGNKMYGKHKNKMLYKCIPDNKGLPIFLVPYKIKPNFSKKLTNKYIVFKFKCWENKHPHGVICQTIGDVSILPNFYEYQLHCKSLHASINNFKKKTRLKIREKSEDEHIIHIINTYGVEDRRSNYDIISIDPKGSKDFDDAFSMKETDSNFIFSIYISNVSLWLDSLDLWDYFTTRISTIYLPDGKRSMLPMILSDTLCSLQEERDRFAFTLDLTIHKNTYEIIDTTIINTVINVKRNLRYDTKEQETNSVYKKCLGVITNINKKYNYIDSIDNSHDFIAYIMILMNYICAKKMMKKKIGIYRSAKYNTVANIPTNVTGEQKKFLRMWNSSGGNYLKYQNMEGHDILELDAYIHITSPIRRLVDLLNIIQLQDSLNIFKFNKKSEDFYERWTNKGSFENINIIMKSIRKVQSDCSLLKICMTGNIMQKDGFIFDKSIRDDGLYQYMIFIKEIGMVNRIISRNNIPNYSTQSCKLHLFIDEVRLKQKVRISFINTD
jgi:hypothetical protein